MPLINVYEGGKFTKYYRRTAKEAREFIDDIAKSQKAKRGEVIAAAHLPEPKTNDEDQAELFAIGSNQDRTP